MQLIDTHAHLYLDHFKNDFEKVVIRAKENGVYKIILPNIDMGSVNPMLETSRKEPGFFYPCIGLHPGSVKENYETELNRIFKEAQSSEFIAIGEIGIECYWDISFLYQQIEAFEAQLELSADKNLPVIIHSRDSFDLIIKSLDKFPGKLKGVFDAFTGSILQAQKIIERGFTIGIGGVVTFKNSGLSDVVREIPLEQLILETDSPYLTPAPCRGRRNESSYLVPIAKKIAEEKNIPLNRVAEITTENARLLFGLD